MGNYSILYQEVLRKYPSKYSFILGFVHSTQKEIAALFQPDLYRDNTFQCCGLFRGFTAKCPPRKKQKPFLFPRGTHCLFLASITGNQLVSENTCIN